MTIQEWYQSDKTQCPLKDCKGLLFVSLFHYERKCSYCGKYFMSITVWKEVEDDGR